MTLSGPLFFNRKKSPEAGKKIFFEIFFVVAHLLIETKLFFLSNFHIYSRSEKSWGDKKNLNFLLKMTLQAKKNDFFRIFFLLHIFMSRRNFFVITKISYLQPFREIMGGPEKALHQRRTTTTTNDERTTNDELHWR